MDRCTSKYCHIYCTGKVIKKTLVGHERKVARWEMNASTHSCCCIFDRVINSWYDSIILQLARGDTRSPAINQKEQGITDCRHIFKWLDIGGMFLKPFYSHMQSTQIQGAGRGGLEMRSERQRCAGSGDVDGKIVLSLMLNTKKNQKRA